MSEKELQKLHSLPVPPPGDTAKKLALAAALDAFDDAHAQPQGFTIPARPTPRSHPETRRKPMTFTRAHYAMAASFAALLIAAPMALHLAQDVPDLSYGYPKPAPAESNEIKMQGRIETEIPIARSPPAAEPMRKAQPEEDQRAPQPIAVIPQPAPHDGPGAAGTGRSSPGLLSLNEVRKSITRDPAQAVEQAPGSSAAAVKIDLKDDVRPSPPTAAQRAVSLPPPPAVGELRTREAFGKAKEMEQSRNQHLAVGTYLPPDPPVVQTLQEHRDRFETTPLNPVKQVAAEPVSTFSIDVDTASYAFVRRMLNEGRLPPKSAVRAEEMINYFDYAYPAPDLATEPFKPTVTVVPSPWNGANRLVHIAIKGYELQSAERPRANLVFLVDVSGSMAPADRLPLVKNGLRMLVDELKPDDTIAIVTYASGSGIALEPTKISEKSKILRVLDQLQAGGSTAGAQGIADAYRLAADSFDGKAVNRVILATDGDFNVGMTDVEDLKSFVERKRQSGIFLSILGVGRGNYNDHLMQTLAHNGNGVAAYADTLSEARKVLVEEASSTLFPIAKDVKIQVEWNPERVAHYRLIGYETRGLKREDFNNDKVDAGDIGSGHTVTAIYEITPVGAAEALVDDLRYAKPAERAAAPRPDSTASPAANELGFLKMRFKLPQSDVSTPLSLAITDALAKSRIEDAAADVRFSIAVAGFAELLRGSPHVGAYSFDAVEQLAAAARGEDRFGYRSEFLNLVRLAKSAQP